MEAILEFWNFANLFHHRQFSNLTLWFYALSGWEHIHSHEERPPSILHYMEISNVFLILDLEGIKTLICNLMKLYSFLTLTQEVRCNKNGYWLPSVSLTNIEWRLRPLTRVCSLFTFLFTSLRVYFLLMSFNNTLYFNNKEFHIEF